MPAARHSSAIAGHGAGGEGDDGHMGAGWLGAADLAGGVEAGHTGHLDVHENEIDGGAVQQVKTLLTVDGLQDAATGAFEDLAGNQAVDGVVFDDEDHATGKGGSRGNGGVVVERRIGADRKGEFQPEEAAGAGLALAINAAAHESDQLAADGQAEAGTAEAAGGRVVHLDEGFEDVRHGFRGNADAGILDGDADERTALAGGAGGGSQNADLAGGRELEGIGGEVDDDLAEAVGIADQALGN